MAYWTWDFSHETCFGDEERLKILGTSSSAKFEKQSKHGETQSYGFHAYQSFWQLRVNCS